MDEHLPVFPYGAVYFRKSNPPPEEWDRDYRTAAADGFNVFRHWFMWSAIETAPGTFEWDEYDRQLELAERHCLKTIVGEISHSAPEWAFRRLGHARYERADGSKVESRMRNSSATGGFPGLCLDHDDAQAAVGRFLTELVRRYRAHPALGAYDVWNECNLFSSGFTECYCPATLGRFRAWLAEKYGSPRAVSAAWRRYGYVEWEDIQAPRQTGAYPDSLDWTRFRIDDAYRLMGWRVDLIRSLDPDHPITAHGVAAWPIARMAVAADDHWRAAALVDGYGYTWGGGRYGNEAWQQYHVVDMVRGGARDKPFWHTEATAGPSWLDAAAYAGRRREDGRIPTPADVRLWNLTSFAAGATGLTYNRWRPLLDGPLYGALAPYAMDGSRTPRSAMASKIARWANAERQRALWRSRPVRGEIGIVVVPSSVIFAALQEGRPDHYADAARGAYRGFFDNGIQADWVHIDDIAGYDLLYLPHPVMLPQAAADALARWVAAGGRLVAEGCPGYFDDRGRVGTRQPNLGLDRLFGAVQEEVEFVPDLLADESITFDGAGSARCGLYRQTLRAEGGTATGWYADGGVVVVDHAAGAGRTRLLGTSIGYGYTTAADDATRRAFADLLAWAGTEPHIRTTDSRLQTRLHDGAGGTALWATNADHVAIAATLSLSPRWGPFERAEVLWGETGAAVRGREIALNVPPRDALVVQLMP